MTTYTLKAQPRLTFYVEETGEEETREIILSRGGTYDPASYRKQIGRFKVGDLFWLNGRGIVMVSEIPVGCYGYAEKKIAALVKGFDLPPDDRASRVRLDRLAACRRPSPLDAQEWLEARAFSTVRVRYNVSNHFERLVEVGAASQEALDRYLASGSVNP